MVFGISDVTLNMSLFSRIRRSKTPSNIHEFASELIDAARFGKASEITVLLESEIFAELPAAAKESTLGVALFEAAAEGHLEIVRELAWAGAALDRPHPASGDSALTIAAFTGRNEVVQFLAAYGANINFRNNSGLTPLMLAAGRCDRPTVEQLIKAGADLHAKAQGELDAKAFAESEGKHDIAEMLQDLMST